MGYNRKDIEVERNRIASILKKHWKNKNDKIDILEIGTGTGITREILSGILPVARIFASDISIQMLSEYKKKFSNNPCIACDAEHLPFRPDKFDFVICNSFVHHLPNDCNLLVAIRDV